MYEMDVRDEVYTAGVQRSFASLRMTTHVGGSVLRKTSSKRNDPSACADGPNRWTVGIDQEVVTLTWPLRQLPGENRSP